MLMRIALAAVILPTLLIGNAAFAQVTGMASPTPTVGATSPLGSTMGAPVGPTGIPLGATELSTPGVSPVVAPATGTIAIPNTGTVCSTVGTAPTQMFGSSASFDGGGMAPGSSMPATGAMAGDTAATPGMMPAVSPTSGLSGTVDTSGMSGMCGSGSTSVTASSRPSSTAAGGVPPPGIPLGSSEIGNLGVSSAAPVPMPSVSPFANSAGSITPAAPAVPQLAGPQ